MEVTSLGISNPQDVEVVTGSWKGDYANSWGSSIAISHDNSIDSPSCGSQDCPVIAAILCNGVPEQVRKMPALLHFWKLYKAKCFSRTFSGSWLVLF